MPGRALDLWQHYQFYYAIMHLGPSRDDHAAHYEHRRAVYWIRPRLEGMHRLALKIQLMTLEENLLEIPPLPKKR